MKQGLRTFLSLMAFLTAIITLAGMSGSRSIASLYIEDQIMPPDTGEPDSLVYPIKGTGGLYGNNPSNYTEEVEYDETTGQYVVTQKVGGLVTKPPMFMTPEEYKDYVARKQVSDYWAAKTQSEEAAKAEGRDPGSSLIPQLQVNSELFNKIFGSNTIDIRPQGYAELRFGGRYQKIDNPLIPERNRSTFTFDFDQRIQMNVTGKVGEKLTLATNYDTEATFSFENQTKIEYTGDEDDIIKKIELGNVSLPLNSSLINGAQSLFGVKAQTQFGKLTLTGVLAEQQSQSSSINVQGGATTTEFEISADQYEANRHYFLSHYFRDRYEQFLSTRPLISSPVQITKVEVWVTNTRQSTESNRNIVAFMDLGEFNNSRAYRNSQANLPGPDIFSRFNPTERFPDNGNNSLNPVQLQSDVPGVRNISQATNSLTAAGYQEAIEFTELSNARKLSPNEFDYDPRLGYISLNTALNQDEVLAVAFQFTAGGKTFQVGEFSTDGVTPPKTLIVKMLKSTLLNVKVPMWDLMMKNVYSLNAFQVNQEDFRLEIQYRNDETGTPIPFLPEGNLRNQLLLRVTGLDTLNNNGDPQPDGFFDFIPNVTINPQTSRIFFPVLEPFGSNLAERITDEEIREKYVFQQLYDSTRFKAQNETQLNKYVIKGQFKSSSSSEISLNAFNIPQGSVKVSAGGQALQEGVHYTVDYNLGRVKIIDEGILASGTPIKVDFENNAVFNFQTRNFMGVNADYRVNDNLNVGATIVRLSEKPLTQKVNIGAEPIANTMWGMNASYSQEAPYLTRMVDAIPFIETKEKSNITVSGEFAQLVPGSPRGIEIDGDATTYLDDFESSQTTIDIKNPIAWRLASTPGNQPDLFPEGSLNGLEYGYNRAHLAWYTIDPLFHREDGSAPGNINSNKQLQSGQYVRRVYVKEVFPNIQLQPSDIQNIPMLDLAYYPNKRGPYNYDVEPTGVSAGLAPDESGDLADPKSRWGGIMRDLSTTNFEEQNIEFIQFWIMDPYYKNTNYPDQPDFNGPDPANGGFLYFNLGSVSEDILRDGQQAVENGIPSDGDASKLDSTAWGLVPKVRPTVVAFDNESAVRNSQDVGYDLLSSDQERSYTDGNRLPYLQRLEAQYTSGQNSQAYQNAVNDPAHDNFSYYRGSSLDQANAGILDRYYNYNGTEGNSNTSQVDGVSAFATNQPDVEDINRDQTLSKTEAYYQYRISLRQADLQNVGENYITDIRENVPSEEQPDGETHEEGRWIQFKVPVFSPDKRVGPVSDFRSIRFIRMFMQGWGEPVVVRFAKLELVRGEWRRYAFNLDQFGDELNTDLENQTLFDVNAVNIEQNGNRVPVPYMLPPGIDRQVLFGTTAATQQNEQSLSLRVCELQDGSARAVFRNLNFDMRNYNRLKMFAHAEDGRNAGGAQLPNMLKDDDLTVFIRLGSDYNQNYYEYELPLKVTAQNSTGSYTAEEIWPEANNFDFELNLLKEVKLERDRVYRNDPSANLTQRYSVIKGLATVSVVGAPNLSNVRTMMIGVRNPKKRLAADSDDGMAKCAEVWVNELRLTDFDQRGGWAANARVAAQLADFANVSISGSMSTIGFGSIDQTVSERQKETIYAYDLQSSFELGKFFPKETGMRIPMFIGSSEQWANPQFNPLDPDIEFDDALANLEDDQARAELKEISQDYTRRQSINFTNVKKERAGKRAQKTPMPWDVENLSATYSFTEIFRRNITVKEDIRQDHRGQLNYTYRLQPKPIEPFKNTTWLQNKNLALIKDVNLYYLPKQFSMIGSIDRTTHLLEMRNTDDPFNDDARLPVTENNSFNFNRQYSLLYDITRNLKLDYNANMRTRVDELVGIDPTTGDPYTKEQRSDEIWENLSDFGRPINYHQTVNINWQVPINKLPLLDFVNTQARYTGDFDWATTSLLAQELKPTDSLNFGNTIQNNQQWQFTNNLNLISLYNKVPYLRKVNEGKNNRGREVRQRGPRTPGANRAREEEENKEEEEESTFDKILAGGARGLMMVRNASVNYTRGEGTILPGYLPEATFMGMTPGADYAPGFPFVFGAQTDIQEDALNNDWLTQSHLLSTQYAKTYNENLNLRVTVEPVSSLRIIVSAQKTESSNISSFFRFDKDLDMIAEQSRFETQNYSISYFMLGTAFENLKSPTFSSEAYENFRQYRLDVSRQLAEQYANGEGQEFGYSPDFVPSNDSVEGHYKYYSLSHQQVLIPAFLAAYSGKSIDGYDLNPKKSVPLPNWTLTYDGLSKIKWFQQFFTSVVLNHSYRSTYTIGSRQTNLLYQEALDENPTRPPLDINGDVLPKMQISAVVLTEQFAPLIGFNIKLKNSTTLRLEYKKDRNLTLGLANNQITETKGQEWVIGAGYIIKDVKLGFISLGPRRTNPVSNLELKLDFGIRENLTVIRRIIEDVDQVTAGQTIYTLKFSADYQISKRVLAKIFYDMNLSRYEVSNAYPIDTHQFGISVRLNLGT
jgi:cell surface protein SprA